MALYIEEPAEDRMQYFPKTFIAGREGAKHKCYMCGKKYKSSDVVTALYLVDERNGRYTPRPTSPVVHKKCADKEYAKLGRQN